MLVFMSALLIAKVCVQNCQWNVNILRWFTILTCMYFEWSGKHVFSWIFLLDLFVENDILVLCLNWHARRLFMICFYMYMLWPQLSILYKWMFLNQKLKDMYGIQEGCEVSPVCNLQNMLKFGELQCWKQNIKDKFHNSTQIVSSFGIMTDILLENQTFRRILVLSYWNWVHAQY